MSLEMKITKLYKPTENDIMNVKNYHKELANNESSYAASVMDNLYFEKGYNFTFVKEDDADDEYHKSLKKYMAKGECYVRVYDYDKIPRTMRSQLNIESLPKERIVSGAATSPIDLLSLMETGKINGGKYSHIERRRRYLIKERNIVDLDLMMPLLNRLQNELKFKFKALRYYKVTPEMMKVIKDFVETKLGSNSNSAKKYRGVFRDDLETIRKQLNDIENTGLEDLYIWAWY